MSEFYIDILYFDGRVPLLKEPYPKYNPETFMDENSFNSMLWNTIVLYENEDWEMIKEFKKLFSNNEDDLVAKFGKETINFVMNEMAGFCNKNGLKIYKYPILFDNVISLIMDITLADKTKIDKRLLTTQILPKLINEFVKYQDVRSTIDFSVKNNNEIEIEIEKILNKYPDKVADYRKGKLGVANMMFGELMRSLGGKCNPKEAREMLDKKLI